MTSFSHWTLNKKLCSCLYYMKVFQMCCHGLERSKNIRCSKHQICYSLFLSSMVQHACRYRPNTTFCHSHYSTRGRKLQWTTRQIVSAKSQNHLTMTIHNTHSLEPITTEHPLVNRYCPSNSRTTNGQTFFYCFMRFFSLFIKQLT